MRFNDEELSPRQEAMLEDALRARLDIAVEWNAEEDIGVLEGLLILMGKPIEEARRD